MSLRFVAAANDELSERMSMSSRSPSSDISNLPLDQCLENLKHSILQVIHHDEVSDEARSFLAELIKTILNHTDPMSRPPSGPGSELAEDRLLDDEASARPLTRDLGLPVRPYQVELSSPTGLVLVTNLATGEVITVSQGDLIRWALQNGLDGEDE